MLEESVIYQEIFQKGYALGFEQGLRQGAAKIILPQLTRRLGTLTTQTQTRVTSLSLPLLKLLCTKLFEFQNKHQLIGWLRRHGA